MLLMEIETPTPESPDGRPFKGWLGAEPGHEDEAPVFVRREGRTIVFRKKDPCDPDPPRIPFYEGDELIQMEAISHTSVNTTSEVGDTLGLVFSLRLVPTRREPGRVYARTLRHGEKDDGRRVHVEPGETLVIEQLTVALDHLDAMQEPTESGYVPLTPVLWSWFAIGERDDAQSRYLLAAARRLDQANELLMAVERHRAVANEAGKFGPAVRRHVFAMLGAIESSVVALGRAIDMAERAATRIGVVADLPSSITTHRDSVRAIRNAYEHIEDRALGNVRGQPDPVALTIFDHDTLLREDAIVYGTHRLTLDDDLPRLLAETREYLKIAARDRANVPAGSQ
ncbi:hypothetical protein [Paeniglutamicibacter sp.]|uniref:hypothetical protein n=1 Tax=Paeniglutamicibacter sp. TaxID=1934391 RepID=UPI0039897B9C